MHCGEGSVLNTNNSDDTTAGSVEDTENKSEEANQLNSNSEKVVQSAEAIRRGKHNSKNVT